MSWSQAPKWDRSWESEGRGQSRFPHTLSPNFTTTSVHLVIMVPPLPQATGPYSKTRVQGAQRKPHSRAQGEQRPRPQQCQGPHSRDLGPHP